MKIDVPITQSVHICAYAIAYLLIFSLLRSLHLFWFACKNFRKSFKFNVAKAKSNANLCNEICGLSGSYFMHNHYFSHILFAITPFLRFSFTSCCIFLYFLLIYCAHESNAMLLMKAGQNPYAAVIYTQLAKAAAPQKPQRFNFLTNTYAHLTTLRNCSLFPSRKHPFFLQYVANQ